MAPQIFTEARDQDVGSDRRNIPWSPENILIDTVARLQRDFRMPGAPHVVLTPRQAAFTTTKVPRFAGKTSWDQYRQVFEAMVCSNGWDDATAALQLLSHLEGYALNVALLVIGQCSTETPIRDVVDRCQVWECHADPEIRRVSKPGPDPVYLAYVVGDSDTGVEDIRVAAVTKPKSTPDQADNLFRQLLQLVVVNAACRGVSTTCGAPGNRNW